MFPFIIFLTISFSKKYPSARHAYNLTGNCGSFSIKEHKILIISWSNSSFFILNREMKSQACSLKSPQGDLRHGKTNCFINKSESAFLDIESEFFFKINRILSFLRQKGAFDGFLK